MIESLCANFVRQRAQHQAELERAQGKWQVLQEMENSEKASEAYLELNKAATNMQAADVGVQIMTMLIDTMDGKKPSMQIVNNLNVGIQESEKV
jgi:hypothetical protein